MEGRTRPGALDGFSERPAASKRHCLGITLQGQETAVVSEGQRRLTRVRLTESDEKILLRFT